MLDASFPLPSTPFTGYIQQIARLLEQVAPLRQSPKFREANTPFELIPPHGFQSTNGSTYEKGILLVHGLFDSPYTMRKLAEAFQQQGFLVHTLLLPGHGTLPSALQDISYHSWIQCVHQGVTTLQRQVDKLYIGGFSLGGALALHEALRGTPLAGILLFAPAIALKNFPRLLIPVIKRLPKWLLLQLWIKKAAEVDYARYCSFAFNAGLQTVLLMEENQKRLNKQVFNTPLFIATSEDDETVSLQATTKLYDCCQYSQKQFRLYCKNPSQYHGSNITAVDSRVPSKGIIDMSHLSIHSSPEDPHYGEGGDYQDFQHYPESSPIRQEHGPENICLGAVSKKNLAAHTMQRLTYNPDFTGLLTQIWQFIADVESNLSN